MTVAPAEFRAIVLAVQPVTEKRVCGLTVAERGRRMAKRSGAAAVVVVERATDLGDLTPDGRDLLLVRVRDQLVHFPLIDAVRDDALRDGGDSSRSAPAGSANATAITTTCTVAIDPVSGEYAGALWVPANRVGEALDTLRAHPMVGDSVLAKRWLEAGVARESAHGDIARHAVATPEERRGATKMLFRLAQKPQDSPLSQYVNRRVSYPLTRLLLPTPITPNMLSATVFAIGVTGCWFVAQGSYSGAVLGCVLVLFAGYLDGCDGEIARLRHEGSTVGAWLDTIVDETTTVLFLVATGLHYYVHDPSTWVVVSIIVGTCSAVLSVYIIYYYLVVVAKSGNSQDYPTRSGGYLDYLRVIIKRDFINLAAVGLAIAGLTQILYLGICLGAVATALVLVPQHIALRLSLANGGMMGESAGKSGVAGNDAGELAPSASGSFTKL